LHEISLLALRLRNKRREITSFDSRSLKVKLEISNLVKITVEVEEETIEIQINFAGMRASDKRIR